MADERKIRRAIVNAHRAGDTAAAEKLAAVLKRMTGAGGKDTRPQSPVPIGPTDMIIQGFGIGDEVGGAGAATGAFLKSVGGDILSGELPDLGEATAAAGKSYGRRRDEIRRGVDEYRAEHPIAATGLEVLGGLATGGTLAKGGATLLNAARPTIASMVGRGAVEGSAYGGLHGFGSGEGFEDRIKRAGGGALLGAGAGGAVGAVGAGMVGRAAGKAVPTADDLRKASDAAYRTAEGAGLVVAPQSFSTAVDDIVTAARTAGIDRTIHPKASAALARLEDAKGMEPTLQDIDTLRRVIGGAAKSIEPDERRIASIMIDKLDDYMAGLSPSDVLAGDPEVASQAIREARELWSRFRKTEMIEDAVERAMDRSASTGSGGNVDNAIRQNIRTVLNNPKKARGFTEAERDLMRKVVRGGPVQNLARLVGKLSPQGNGLMLLLHGTGGIATGGATLPLAAVGSGAKAIADRATPANVNSLLQTVRAGGTPPQGLLSLPQQAVLGGLLVGGAQQGSGLLGP